MFDTNQQKLLSISFISSVIIGITLFGFSTRANNDIFVTSQLWETGLDFWVDKISVVPGQEFKIELITGNFSADTSVTNVKFIDELPYVELSEGTDKTTFVIGSAYQILDNLGIWQELTDDGTSPFDEDGLIVTNDGTLSPFEFANYKYTVKVPDFIPSNTSEIMWNGPVLHFTDGTGAQTIQSENDNSIYIEQNTVIISHVLTTGTHFKLGDKIDFTVNATSEKDAKVLLGDSRTVQLSETSVGVYTGSYTVLYTDDSTDITPRIQVANINNTGVYTDHGTSISLDGILPNAPTNLSKTLNENTLEVTITWDLPSDESDIAYYNVYSDQGTGTIDYSIPVAQVMSGTNSYTTDPLTQNIIYQYSVRAEDDAGNIEQNTNSISISTDVTPPESPANLLTPTITDAVEHIFTGENPIEFTWDVSTSGDVSIYRVEIVNDDGTFSVPIASFETNDNTPLLEISIDNNTFVDDVYKWRVFAIDGSGNVSEPTEAPNARFEIDTTDPEISITSPETENHISGNFTIIGTAVDSGTHAENGTGIKSVYIIFSDLGVDVGVDTPLYWNGNNWVENTELVLVDSENNFNNWLYSSEAEITDLHNYVFYSRVIDNAGHSIDSNTITLTGNTSDPEIEITSPINNTFYNAGFSIVGNASDPGETVLSNLEISVQRNSDSNYWNGSNWIVGETWNTVTTENNFMDWEYDFTAVLNQINETKYTISAKAIDGVFGAPNTGYSNDIVITQDTIAGVASISSPTVSMSPYSATTWVNITPVIGTALDSTSGISLIEIYIQDINGDYWNGIDWITSASIIWLNTSSVDSYITWKYLDQINNYIPNKNGSFTFSARAHDKALPFPNVSNPTVPQTVIYDTNAPVITNVVVDNDTIESTEYIKKGDFYQLSANLSDMLSEDMELIDITANLSELTSSAGSVSPINYGNEIANWQFLTVNTNLNGPISVSITATDPAGNSVNTSNVVIISDNTNATIKNTTLSIPSVQGIVWAGGSTQTILWNKNDITDANLGDTPITISYSTNNGLTWAEITTNQANDGSYEWTLPSDVNSETVTIQISVKDLAGNISTDESNNSFTIDSTAPTVTTDALTSPNGAEAWKQNTVQTITWNINQISDNFNLNASPISIEYTIDGETWVLISTNELNNGAFNWTIPELDSINILVRIGVTDQAGNISYDKSNATFAIGLPPVVIGSRAINDTLIEIEFDKALSSAGDFTSYTASGIATQSASVWDLNNRIIRLTVSSLGDTAFSAADLKILANTLKDTDNFVNELVNNTNIDDKQIPQIIDSKIYALNGNDYVVVKYSEPIASNSATNQGNYALESPIGQNISLSNAILTTLNSGTIRIKLADEAVLVNNDQARITILGVTDTQGNSIDPSVQINNLVQSGITITEVVTDPRQDWSSTNFIGTPGGTGDVGDRFIELHIDANNLDLTNWSISLGRKNGSSEINALSTITGINNNLLSYLFDYHVYLGSGSISNTNSGDIIILGGDTFGAMGNNMRIIISEQYGILTDNVTMGNFDDANILDNSPSGNSIAVYDESISRDKYNTDTNIDINDWHKMQSTPGYVDTTPPMVDFAQITPKQNELTPSTLPIYSIKIIDDGSGIRNNVSIDPSYENQIILLVDGVEVSEDYNPLSQVVTYIPNEELSYGKHVINITIRDNAGNSLTHIWDFWVDNFMANVVTTPINFLFSGYSQDRTTPEEQQSISVSTYGVGFKIYARIKSAINDGFNNIISDLALRNNNENWNNAVNLDGLNLIEVGYSNALTIPSAETVTTEFTFDTQANLSDILQPNGEYQGSLEFIIVPEY